VDQGFRSDTEKTGGRAQMINAILVDDEEWIRIGLRMQADWNGLGIQVAGEAADGATAIDLIQSLHPEIVVTDIRMPKKDGVDLLDYIYHNCPDTIVIVISGYSKFEYAQKAIAYKAFDYILKPIEEEILDNTLRGAIVKINENKSRLEIQSLKSRLKRNDSFIKEKMFADLIFGAEIKPDELPGGAGTDFFFSQGAKRLAVFETVNFDAVCADTFENDASLADYAVQNIMEELTRTAFESIVVRNYRKHGELILLAPDRSFARRNCLALLAETLKTIEHYTGFRQYGAVSGAFFSVEESTGLYLKAAETAKDAGMIASGGIIFTDEALERTSYFTISDDRKKMFSLYIGNGSEYEANELVNRLFSEIEADRQYSPKSVRNAVLELVILLNGCLKEYGANLEDLLNSYHYENVLMNEYFTLDGLKSWFKEMMFKVLFKLREIKKREGKRTIREIVEYVDKKFSDKISLSGIAEKYYLNTTYLSRVFKAETGQNFNDYVNMKRMQSAAELMLDGSMKAKDISEIVGFDNVNYFFKRFKEYYHCTPTEFKAKGDT
jgi:two-component system response regulator YesN